MKKKKKENFPDLGLAVSVYSLFCFYCILFIFIIDCRPVDGGKSDAIEVIDRDNSVADIGCGVLYREKYPHSKCENTGDKAHILGVYVSYGGENGNYGTEGKDYCVEHGDFTGENIIFGEDKVAECPQGYCYTENDKFAVNGKPTELYLFAAGILFPVEE